MKKMLALLVSLALFAPLLASADIASDVHFATDGTFTATNLTVFQKAGHNFYVRATWGQAFIRITVITNSSTVVTKAHGEPATVDDIQEGDVFDLTGALNFGGDTISINAKTIQDSALQSSGKTLSGSVKSVGADGTSFVLSNGTFGTTTIRMGEGATITKGARTIFIPDLAVGDKVLSAVGTYDYTSNTLTASSVSIYQTQSIFVAKNFQGTLKSLSGTTLPVTAVVTVSGKDYTVFVPAGTPILNSAKAPASLSRFVVGDTVRFYGSIRQTDFSQVDAQVLRDLNF
jgi:hypothetical protein